MGNLFNIKTASCLLEKLQKEYDVYGPKRFPGDGCFSDTVTVRYGILNSLEELVWDK